MGGQSLEELPREQFLERDSGQVVEGTRIYGWIVWSGDGPELVEPGDFETQYEPLENEY
jgi:hypothetical protein